MPPKTPHLVESFRIKESEQPLYSCPACKRACSRYTWMKHYRKGCSQELRPDVECLACHQKFTIREKMIEHYIEMHEPIEIKTLHVKSKEALGDFRYSLKRAGHRWRNRGMNLRNSNCYWRCDDFYSCTAYICVKILPDGSFDVTYIDHHSHPWTPNDLSSEDNFPSTSASEETRTSNQNCAEEAPQLTYHGPPPKRLKVEEEEDVDHSYAALPISMADAHNTLMRLEKMIAEKGSSSSKAQRALQLLDDLAKVVGEANERE